MAEPLHARIGRTVPNPLFGALVQLSADAPPVARSAGCIRGDNGSALRPDGAPAALQGALRMLRGPLDALRARCAPLWRSVTERQRHVALLLGVLLLALWPHLTWMAQRLTDGSDEPWGALALATVLVLLLRDRAALAMPSSRALATSAVLALCAAAALWWLPALLAAAIAMLALAVFVTAALSSRPATPMATLLLLSLPLIASLQFYLGFPLRVATAHAAAPLLALFGVDATPAGAALQAGALTVLIDAPCAGIGMLWVGSYTAALLSYLNGASARRTLANGAVAALIVFAANVLRNVALFFPEAGLIDAPAAAHDVVGLLAFAVALVPIVQFTQWRRVDRPSVSRSTSTTASITPVATTSSSAPPAVRVTARARAPYVGACLAAAVVPLVVSVLARDAASAAPVRSAVPAAIDWPTTFRGQPLTQLALTPLEARFSQRASPA